MNNDDIFYYQKELANLNQTREYFVKRFPKLAPFLAFDSKDPDVERIIENLAILTSKIHQEIDQNIPQIAESLLNIISPNYTNPLPSLCLQEFTLKPDSKENHFFIKKGSYVKSNPIEQVECDFKTIYDVYLYPLEVEEVFINSERHYQTLTLRLTLNKPDIEISDIGLKCLQIYLGNDVYASSNLLLFLNCYLEEARIISCDTQEAFKLTSIENMGLNPNESMLNYNDLGFESFALLREYFFMPEKFNFIKIKGLEAFDIKGRMIDLQFKFNKPFPKNCIIRKDLFALNITPTINIFPKSAESIVNDHSKDGYRIFIDRMNLDAYEIIQINQVKAHSNITGRRMLKNYKSFERFEFLAEGGDEFYSVHNKKNYNGETYKEISFFSHYPHNEIISIDALCCNKNLPTKLKIGDIKYSKIEGINTKNITIPSAMREYGGNSLWNLVSILSFNYQSILDVASFFSVIESYGFINDKANRDSYNLLKNSIIDMHSKPTYLVDGYITKKGTLCVISIRDSNFYTLGEVYKLGLILSKFFTSFVSINSFCELEIKCLDSGEILYYPANSGRKISL